MSDILSGDFIRVEDITNRVEELEDEQESAKGDWDELSELDAPPEFIEWEKENAAELDTLRELLSDLCGDGGNHQWRGDWYPDTLIADDHFTDFARELVEDCYSLKLPDFVEVDWEATAENVKEDYSMVDIGENTYWYR